MLDVRKLRTLAELDRLGTIAAVARHLQLTAPGVSMQLAALEREMGLALTERQGRRVVLTAAGKVLAQHGHDLADMVTVAEMEAAALRDGTAGTYRIAAFPTAARSFIAVAWNALRTDPGSGMNLYLIESEPQEALPALAAGEVELAVTHSYSNLPDLPSPTLVAVPIAIEDVLLALPAGSDDQVPGPLPADPAVSLSNYAHHNWVLPLPHLTCHTMVQHACASAGFSPRPVANATDYSVQLALVAAGAGVALIPRLGCTDLPAGVQLRRLVEPVQRRSYTVSRNNSRTDRGLHHLQRLIADAAKAVIPSRHLG